MKEAGSTSWVSGQAVLNAFSTLAQNIFLNNQGVFEMPQNHLNMHVWIQTKTDVMEYFCGLQGFCII